MSSPPDIRLKPPCDRADALVVLSRLRQAGHVAYFAGGCVRDMLLGLTPKDYDIATDAPPPRVRELFSNTQAVGAAFGVILVRHNNSVIEIATFRSDGIYADGRRPQSVRFTTAREDAQRRDFTINGLFFDPIENKVIDYVDGQADLAAHRLRAIGNPIARFTEDHLRLPLRAVRFASRFNLTIDPATQAAIQQSAPRLKTISPERIGDELRLMLTPTTRQAAWKLLWDLHLGSEIFRFLPTGSDFIFNQTRSLFLSLDESHPIPFSLALAAIALDILIQSAPARTLLDLLGKKQVHHSVTALRTALRISNEESDQMSEILSSLGPLLADPPPTLAQKRRFLARPTAEMSRALLSALEKLNIHKERISTLKTDLSHLDGQNHAPTPLLTGDDLATAGLTPGPAFKTILDTVYDAQLENAITTKQQALTLALQINSR